MYVNFVEIAILLAGPLVACGLFWLDRGEPAYLWLDLTCAAILGRLAIVVMTNYTAWIGVSSFS